VSTTATAATIAVAVPARNARAELWRSLAALTAQSLPPRQILVLDQASADGTADWLRLHWPGVELERVGRAPAATELLQAALGRVSCHVLAFLTPGEGWPEGHLARLAARWAEAHDTDLVLTPMDRAEGPLAGVSVRVEALARRGAADLLGDVRCGRGAAAAAAHTEEAPADGAAWLSLLRDALRALPPGKSVQLVGLQAASRPAGLLDLLGLAVIAAEEGRWPTATTLAELSWADVEGPPDVPVLVTTPAALDLARAAEQLCVEEIVRRASDRPVRLAARAFVPSTPRLTSRLIDALGEHPDAELWVNDAVSWRYGRSVLEPARVRLVPPPLLALLPALRTLDARALLAPELLGAGREPAGAERFADLDAWTEGCDLPTARRVALPLARVLGLDRALRGAVLHEAWVMALIGWAAFHDRATALATGEADVALFAAMAGARATLDARMPKTADLAETWTRALDAIGVRVGASGEASSTKKKTCDTRSPPSQVQMLSPQRDGACRMGAREDV